MIDRTEARHAIGVEYSDNFNIMTVQPSIGQEPCNASGIAMQNRPAAHCDVYQMDELRSERSARHHQEDRCQYAK
jgi:hypothetical protein